MCSPLTDFFEIFGIMMDYKAFFVFSNWLLKVCRQNMRKVKAVIESLRFALLLLLLTSHNGENKTFVLYYEYCYDCW